MLYFTLATVSVCGHAIDAGRDLVGSTIWNHCTVRFPDGRCHVFCTSHIVSPRFQADKRRSDRASRRSTEDFDAEEAEALEAENELEEELFDQVRGVSRVFWQFRRISTQRR